MNEFFAVIRRVGIFIICAQTITHFRPKASYEKYLRLLVSTMVMVQLLIPILGIFRKGVEEEFAGLMQKYESAMNRSMEWIGESSGLGEDLQQEYVMQEIYERLKEVEAVEPIVVEEVEVAR
ncbi:MAG: hypothetical protein E7293_10045 [Lachnospiraceae bacterium]|nr:hypothetical protein [Lachnospiraceae bacterium]